MIKIMKPDFQFGDERGMLTQLVHEGFNQINVIESKAGFIRGGHYHKLNKEAFFVVDGQFELIVKRDSIGKKYKFSKGDMFLIPEFISHDFIFNTDTILVSMYDKGVELEDGTKDIIKTE